VKKIYVVRHCKAESQHPQAPLTAEGRNQAEELADFFTNVNIQKIISSPFLRARQSIEPLARKLNIDIKVDDRLSERILSINQFPDWLKRLEDTFEDMDLSFEGGESSRIAMNRAVSVIQDIFVGTTETTVIVTHGNLMTLILKHFDERFGFEEWKSLTNPDVYVLSQDAEQFSIKHDWL
jgi:2,3-bisphosphoglycerate-dependent phosphoglycerate mutase